MAGARSVLVGARRRVVVDVAVREELVWIEIFEVQLVLGRICRELFLLEVVGIC